jgi:hypothetical protein
VSKAQLLMVVTEGGKGKRWQETMAGHCHGIPRSCSHGYVPVLMVMSSCSHVMSYAVVMHMSWASAPVLKVWLHAHSCHLALALFVAISILYVRADQTLGGVGKPTATDLLYRTHGTLKVGRMKRVGAAERATA